MDIHKKPQFLRGTFDNVESKIVQEDHPTSPYYVYLNSEWLGSLKGIEHSNDVLYLIQQAYDSGIEKGKKMRSMEIRRLL